MIQTHYYNKLKSLNAITLVRSLTTNYYKSVGYRDIFEAIDSRLVRELLNEGATHNWEDGGITKFEHFQVYGSLYDILQSEASILVQAIHYEPKKWIGYKDGEMARQDYLMSIICGFDGTTIATRGTFLETWNYEFESAKNFRTDEGVWDYDDAEEMSVKLISKIYTESLRIKSVKVTGTSYDVDFKLPMLTLGRSTATTIGVKIKTKGSGNSYTIRDEHITYHNGLQEMTENRRWRREGRQSMKISKFLRNFNDCISVVDDNVLDVDTITKVRDRYLEVLATSLKPKEVNILISDDVSGIYNTKTAELGSGTLGSSCMNKESYNSTSAYLDFYNGTAKIAYALNSDGHLQSRALIWDVVIEEDGETIKATMMDRIYGTEATQDAYKRFAQKKCWWHKKDQSYSSVSIVDKDGEEKSTYRTTKVVDKDSNEAPYVDTLKFYTREGYLVSKGDYNGYDIVDELTRLEDGGNCPNCGEPCDDDDYVWVDNSDEQGCPECTVWLNYEDESEFRDNVNEVMINGDYTFISDNFCESDHDLAFVPDKDEYIDIDYVAWLEDEGEYILLDDAIYCQHNDTYIRLYDSVELHDGEMAHTDDATETYKGVYYLSEDVIELQDGGFAHKYDDDVVEVDGVNALKSDCSYDKENDEYKLN